MIILFKIRKKLKINILIIKNLDLYHLSISIILNIITKANINFIILIFINVNNININIYNLNKKIINLKKSIKRIYLLT